MEEENYINSASGVTKEGKKKMINEILHSRLIAYFLGSWSFYCGSIGAYDGALFIPMIYALLLLLNHIDQKKSEGSRNAHAQSK